MSQYIDLTLDRPRRFRLTNEDWRDAARRYSAYMGFVVTTMDLAIAVGKEDPAAVALTLAMGCRHEDPKLKFEKIMDALDARRASGEPQEDIGEAILSELRRLGVIQRQRNGGPEADDPNAQAATSSSM